MTRMRAMDAAFLAMERPAEPRHLGSVSIFGAGPGRPADVRRRAVAAGGAARPHPLGAAASWSAPRSGLGRPSWGPSRGFDLEFHLRQDAVAAPGGSAELADLVARIHALPLDRSRPLWELWVIDGLADGRVALYAKIHVAALDEVTGAEVMTALLDPDPTGAPRPAATAR